MDEVGTPDVVRFLGLFTQPLVVRFDQPDSSRDAGAALLRGVDDRLALPRVLSGALADRRQGSKVQHSLPNVLRQRIYGIACGYRDNNDTARLRHDPTQRLLLDRDRLSSAALAPQLTLSRFEHGVSARELLRWGTALMACVIERQRIGGRVKRIAIDLDGTDDPVHG